VIGLIASVIAKSVVSVATVVVDGMTFLCSVDL